MKRGDLPLLVLMDAAQAAPTTSAAGKQMLHRLLAEVAESPPVAVAAAFPEISLRGLGANAGAFPDAERDLGAVFPEPAAASSAAV